MNCKGDRRPRRTGEAGNSPHWSLMGNIVLALTWDQDFHLRTQVNGLDWKMRHTAPSHDSALHYFASVSLHVYLSPNNCRVNDCIRTAYGVVLLYCHHSLRWKWRQLCGGSFFIRARTLLFWYRKVPRKARHCLHLPKKPKLKWKWKKRKWTCDQEWAVGSAWSKRQQELHKGVQAVSHHDQPTTIL